MNDATPPHDGLPLPDYDHLPTGSLQSRVRTLEAAGVEELIAYERSHGNRTPVLQVLERRLEELVAGGTPSGGDPSAPAPEAEHAPPTGSRVSPDTQGPPVNPPSQGVPTNPAQPRG